MPRSLRDLAGETYAGNVVTLRIAFQDHIEFANCGAPHNENLAGSTLSMQVMENKAPGLVPALRVRVKLNLFGYAPAREVAGSISPMWTGLYPPIDLK